MESNNEQLFYELIDIEWHIDYDFEIEGHVSVVADGSSLEGVEENPDKQEPKIERDAEGIPTSSSKDVWPIRREIINNFFSHWYEEHQPDTQVFNLPLQANIRVRAISIIEAKEHACKSYKSTIAVVKYLDRILSTAIPVRNLPVKAGNKNQSKFDKMLVMQCEIPELGTVKLTVGIKQLIATNEEQKTQYGISVLREGQPIVDTEVKATKKAPHKK